MRRTLRRQRRKRRRRRSRATRARRSRVRVILHFCYGTVSIYLSIYLSIYISGVVVCFRFFDGGAAAKSAAMLPTFCSAARLVGFIASLER